MESKGLRISNCFLNHMVKKTQFHGAILSCATFVGKTGLHVQTRKTQANVSFWIIAPVGCPHSVKLQILLRRN